MPASSPLYSGLSRIAGFSSNDVEVATCCLRRGARVHPIHPHLVAAEAAARGCKVERAGVLHSARLGCLRARWRGLRRMREISLHSAVLSCVRVQWGGIMVEYRHGW